MRRFFGPGLVVVGIILMAYGLDSSDSLRSRVTLLFSGRPNDGGLWLLIGGTLAVATGLSLAACRRPG